MITLYNIEIAFSRPITFKIIKDKSIRTYTNVYDSFICVFLISFIFYRDLAEKLKLKEDMLINLIKDMIEVNI